jgi:hypothetical protein
MAPKSSAVGKAKQSESTSEVAPCAGMKRSPEQIALDLQFFTDHKKQVWSDMQAGSDEFDRGLLTLSSGALALSLAFIKDVVPLAHATHLPILFASWICFAVCMIVTLASFRFSIVAQERHLEYARRFHIDGDQDALNDRHWSAKALTTCAYTGGIVLLIGFVLTIWFAVININSEKARRMTENDTKQEQGQTRDARFPIAIVQSGGYEERGRQPIPITANNTVEKGRQPVAPVATTPTPSPADGQAGGNGGSGKQNSGQKK